MDKTKSTDLVFRTRYVETDQMGVIHHSNYLIWFEMGRTEYSTRFGLPYTRIEEEGFLFLVVESQVRYRKPAFYDDELVVRTWCSELKPVTFKFQYEIIRKSSGELIADGFTKHVNVSKETRKPARMPAHIMEVMS